MGGSCKPGLEVCLCIRIWFFDILFPLLEKAAEFIVLGQNHVQVNNSRTIKSELWGSDDRFGPKPSLGYIVGLDSIQAWAQPMTMAQTCSAKFFPFQMKFTCT